MSPLRPDNIEPRAPIRAEWGREVTRAAREAGRLPEVGDRGMQTQHGYAPGAPPKRWPPRLLDRFALKMIPVILRRVDDEENEVTTPSDPPRYDVWFFGQDPDEEDAVLEDVSPAENPHKFRRPAAYDADKGWVVGEADFGLALRYGTSMIIVWINETISLPEFDSDDKLLQLSIDDDGKMLWDVNRGKEYTGA